MSRVLQALRLESVAMAGALLQGRSDGVQASCLLSLLPRDAERFKAAVLRQIVWDCSKLLVRAGSREANADVLDEGRL